MRKVEPAGESTQWIAVRRLKDLANADDIYPLADDLEDLRRMTEGNVCEAVRLGYESI